LKLACHVCSVMRVPAVDVDVVEVPAEISCPTVTNGYRFSVRV
jgi:hypothetical protein